ncbi:hypothetical protein V8C34DRAFT_278870 [Trichoderma compactum]
MFNRQSSIVHPSSPSPTASFSPAACGSFPPFQSNFTPTSNNTSQNDTMRYRPNPNDAILHYLSTWASSGWPSNSTLIVLDKNTLALPMMPCRVISHSKFLFKGKPRPLLLLSTPTSFASSYCSERASGSATNWPGITSSKPETPPCVRN